MHLDSALSNGFNDPHYHLIKRLFTVLAFLAVGAVILVENRRSIPLAKFTFGAGIVGQVVLVGARFKFYLAGHNELPGYLPYLVVIACAILGGLMAMWAFRVGMVIIFALIGILIAKLLTLIPFLNSDVVYIILATCLLVPFGILGYFVTPLFEIFFSAFLGGMLFMAGIALLFRSSFSDYVLFDLKVVYTPASSSVAIMVVLSLLLAIASLIVNHSLKQKHDCLLLNRCMSLPVLLADVYPFSKPKVYSEGIV
ncbi:hypothetical protein DSO57_1021641 [Entomophthora muscae]|uniref:Uncharacterized protein n=1 Tax=Entomophthora muscae TaxID=34485 RepID=A0ACC2RUK0_9FUNG|nr:hypothetical protein DSO57_1021641 [Entomophthora muscae]